MYRTILRQALGSRFAPLLGLLRRDPDRTVFWLITTLCAIYGLLVPAPLPAVT